MEDEYRKITEEYLLINERQRKRSKNAGWVIMSATATSGVILKEHVGVNTESILGTMGVGLVTVFAAEIYNWRVRKNETEELDRRIQDIHQKLQRRDS